MSLASLVCCSFVADVLVDVEIVLARAVPGMVAPHPVHHQPAKFLRVGIPQTERPTERRLDSLIICLMENVAVPLLVRTIGIVAVKHRVAQTTDRSYDRDRAIFQRDHLHEPARFVVARHHEHVRACIDEMGQLGIEPELQVAVGTVVDIVLDVPEVAANRRIGAGSHCDKLGTVPQ